MSVPDVNTPETAGVLNKSAALSLLTAVCPQEKIHCRKGVTLLKPL